MARSGHAPSMSPDGCAMERLGAGACEPAVSLLTPSLMRMEPRLPPLSALAARPDPAGPAPDTAGRPSPLAAGPGAQPCLLTGQLGRGQLGGQVQVLT